MKNTSKELPLFTAIFKAGYPNLYFFRLANEEEKLKADKTTKFIHYRITEENNNERSSYNTEFCKVYEKVHGWGNVVWDVVDKKTFDYIKAEFNLPNDFDNTCVANLFSVYMFLANETNEWQNDEGDFLTSRKDAIKYLVKYGIKFPEIKKTFLNYIVKIKNRELHYKTTQRGISKIKESISYTKLK